MSTKHTLDDLLYYIDNGCINLGSIIYMGIDTLGEYYILQSEQGIKHYKYINEVYNDLDTCYNSSVKEKTEEKEKLLKTLLSRLEKSYRRLKSVNKEEIVLVYTEVKCLNI